MSGELEDLENEDVIILNEVRQRLNEQYFEAVLQGESEETGIYGLEDEPDLDEVDFDEYWTRFVNDEKVIFSGPGRNIYLGQSSFHDKNTMSTSEGYDENDEIVEDMILQYMRHREEELS